MNTRKRDTNASRPGGRAATAAGRSAAQFDAPSRGGRPKQARTTVEGNLAVAAEPAIRPDGGRSAERAPLRVAPPAPTTGPRMPFIVLVLVLVIGGVLGILLLNTKINENAFRLSDLDGRQAELNTEQEQLDRELAEKASAGYLEAEAKRFGLVPADKPAYLRMPDGKVIGVPKPANGEPSVTSQSGSGGR